MKFAPPGWTGQAGADWWHGLATALGGWMVPCQDTVVGRWLGLFEPGVLLHGLLRKYQGSVIMMVPDLT